MESTLLLVYKRLGIDENICNEVNMLIDFPERWIKEKLGFTDEEIRNGIEDGLYIGSRKVEYSSCVENIRMILVFKRLAKEWNDKGVRIPIKFGHDFGRPTQRKWQAEILLICAYEYYGVQGIKASILHHVLDYIEKVSKQFSKDEILRRVEEKFEWLTILPNPKKVD